MLINPHNEFWNICNDFIPGYSLHNFSEPDKKIFVTRCKFNSKQFSDKYYNHLPFNEPFSIKSAVIKRRAEFLAGRLMAVIALEHIGIKQGNIPIGHNRMPIWPEEYVGSITHSSELALAVASPKQNILFTGIDCEEIFSPSTAENISSELLSSNELELFNSSKLNFSLYCTIVFSAKESLFKALYPYVGKYFDFRVAELIEINPNIGKFKIKINQTLNNSNIIKGLEFSGRIEICQSYVLTIISNPPNKNYME